MRKLKMILMAVTAIIGIGGAFAFNRPVKPIGTIYYAHKGTDGHVRWVTSPSGRCSSFTSLACTITSTSDVSNVVDAFPAQYSLAGTMTPNAVYQ